MDPITQGVLGGVASQVVSKPSEKRRAAVIGIVSGMAADLDVLIRSNTDPMLALEYHRQFTHSLFFIPIGALLCALLFHYLIMRQRQVFAKTYLFAFAGYATHAVLDACTTYGTLLLWPFSNMRVAWNNVSVVDPLFTLPLLLFFFIALRKRATQWGIVAAVYAVSYLSLGLVQNQRASDAALSLANSRGHQAIRLGVKPSFANIVVWKSVYEYQGRYYVDAIRVLENTKVIEGSSTEKLDLDKHFPWLDGKTQQARDVERFRWFSNQHLGLDPEDPNRIIDIRYSLIPNRMDGMWGIVLRKGAGDNEFVDWTTTRPAGEDMGPWLRKFWQMLRGDLDS